MSPSSGYPLLAAKPNGPCGAPVEARGRPEGVVGPRRGDARGGAWLLHLWSPIRKHGDFDERPSLSVLSYGPLLHLPPHESIIGWINPALLSYPTPNYL